MAIDLDVVDDVTRALLIEHFPHLIYKSVKIPATEIIDFNHPIKFQPFVLLLPNSKLTKGEETKAKMVKTTVSASVLSDYNEASPDSFG